jgi:hypothetical protein
VVNGESPDFNENHQGEGFGGGGGALPPIPGCVVLELFDASNMTLFLEFNKFKHFLVASFILIPIK